MRFLKRVINLIKLVHRDEPIGIWRKKDGKYYCDGDCQSWNIGICTCGLYHAVIIRRDFPAILGWDNMRHRRYHETINHLTFNRLEIEEFCPHKVHYNNTCEQCVTAMYKLLEESGWHRS